MILVDTSVWIDYFNGRVTPETDVLDALLGREPILIGDLILTEVLQGFRRDAEYRKARLLLEALDFRVLGGRQVALRQPTIPACSVVWVSPRAKLST